MYYIYYGRLNGEIVYIGKGKGDRFRHLNSGMSSCYFANKAHFEGEVVDVEIVERFENNDDALSRESELIRELNPLWNYQLSKVKPLGHNPNKRIRKATGVQRVKLKNGYAWKAYIRIEGSKVHIGQFKTEKEAIDARKKFEESM